MKAVFEPARPSVRKVVISVSIQEGERTEKTQWIAGQASAKLSNGKRMVTVILAPESWKGYAFLMWEPENEPKAMWRYLPALHKLTKLAPADAHQYFFDTDFTYADLGFVNLDGKYALLGQESLGGVSTYKIEETVPFWRAYYSRIVTWVATDSMLPLQREFYDFEGELWKTERFDQVETIDHVPTPLHISMQDVQGNSTTELRFEQVQYDIDIPDAIFDPYSLSRAADVPLWQAYRTPVRLSQKN
jgi:outer membrane lipoprotein-sorting protein